MKYGKIICNCGQEFYFETLNNFLNCISCGKRYDVESFEEMPENIEEIEGLGG